MKRSLLFGLFAVLVLLLFACRAAETSAMQPSEAPNGEPEVISLEMTAEPYITPEPLISDAWYRERTERIERYVRAYSGLTDERAIAERVGKMQIDPQQKRVAFTFDDGPRDEITDAVLDVCEQYNVRVTFFIKGANIKTHDAELKRMLSLGCEIGNHTWDHVDLEKSTAEEMWSQIGRVSDTIEQLYGYRIRLFRPPYIRYGKKDSDTRNTLTEIMQRYEMAVINHTRSTHDTHADYTEEMIYQRCVDPTDESGHALHNSIILCHDKTMSTVNAFRRAVPELLTQGYQLVTVSELLNCSDDGFHVGWIYSKAD